MITPSPEALRAADATVRDLQRDKKDKKSGPGRNAVVRAALRQETTETLKALIAASDQTLVQWFVAVLADAWCLEDPSATLASYDLAGWNSKKGAMPHVEQVRTWLDAELADRRDA